MRNIKQFIFVLAGSFLMLPVFVFADADLDALSTCLEDVNNDFNSTMNLWAEQGTTEEKVNALTQDFYKDTRGCHDTHGSAELIPFELQTKQEQEVFLGEHTLFACLREGGVMHQVHVAECSETYLDDVFDKNIEEEQAALQLKQCSEGESLDALAEHTVNCYAYAEFGNIWDLPIMKKALSESFLDISRMVREPQSSQNVATCVVGLIEQEKHLGDIAEYEREVADCFASEGFLNSAELYNKTALLIDCSEESLETLGAHNITDVMSSNDKKVQSYVEQCIIRKTSPVLTALAAANIPFASGMYNVFLYLQFIFTQPLLLLARKRRKSWGQVFNAYTKQPVDLSVVRLLDAKTKKLRKSMVTGKKGTYLFLAPPGEYHVEVEKRGYSFPSGVAHHEKHESYYFGDSIGIDSEDDVIDKQVPIDPTETIFSISKFRFRKWRYRFTLFVGFLAPLFSIISFVLVPKLWVGLMVVVNVALLVVFIRLGLQRYKRYGVVRNNENKIMSGVVVSLFSKEYNKLIGYYVTDVFGRYFFPAVEGEFSIQCKKEGYEDIKKDFKITDQNLKKGSVGLDIIMKK